MDGRWIPCPPASRSCPPSSPPTWPAARWRGSRPARSPPTASRSRRFSRCLQEDGAPLDPDRLRPDHVIAYLARFAAHRPDTRHRYFREVRCFFRWLRAAGYTDNDPFRGLRNVRLPHTIVPPLAPAEIARLLACCDARTVVGRRDRALLLTLLDTGIRCAEAVQLDLADCDFASRRLHVRHGKGDKARIVPFAARCAGALTAYCADRGPTPGPLFLAARYARLNAGCACVPTDSSNCCGASAAPPASRKVHAHRFRHTFATWAIAHDARELDVQHLLGHRSPDMVRRYSATYGSAQAAERHAAFSPGDQMLARPP